MDEPTGNLDNKTSQLIQDLILNISRNNQIGIILATHDLNFANMMDTVYETVSYTHLTLPTSG